MSVHDQPAEKSPLATVKRSKLDVLDAFDTASAAFVGKFMHVSYFTCLDDIANAIDDLIALVDIYVSATGYKRDSEQLVTKSVDATTTEWSEGSATRAAKPKKKAPQQQIAVVAAHARPHAGRGSGAGQRPPATVLIGAVVALP